ncbi:MAG: bifunctional oligoribonuclease/PAP phosphatase NrnA, partial [Candidatus Hydrogenedentota bacterium]
MIEDNIFLKLKELFEQKDSFLITTHINSDGDGIGSALTLKKVLKLYDKKVEVIIDDRIPDRIKFLPEIDSIKQYSEEYLCQNFDLLIITDTNSLNRIGRMRHFIDRNKCSAIVIIDHHQSGEDVVSLSITDVNASSTSEIIYNFLKYTKIPIEKTIALWLYVGFVVDTGNFSQNNTTKEAMTIAGDLLSYGLDPFSIYQQIYQSRSSSSLKLAGIVLKRALLTKDNLCIYSYLTMNDMKKIRATAGDTEDLINYLREHKDALIVIFFREIGKNKIK